MKFHTHNDKPVNTHLTSLQGYIQASRKELEAVFGKPQELNSDRVSLMWEVEFEDGRTAAIYDWNRDTPEMDEVIGWNIGGKSAQMVYHLHEAFREKFGFIGSMTRKAA